MIMVLCCFSIVLMCRVACMIWYLYCDVYMYSSIGISVNIGRKFLGHSISVQLQHTSTLGCFRLAVAESLEKIHL